MQKHVNLVDLVKCFPTHILLQNLASVQARTSPFKFARSPRTDTPGTITVTGCGRTRRRGSSCTSRRTRQGIPMQRTRWLDCIPRAERSTGLAVQIHFSGILKTSFYPSKIPNSTFSKFPPNFESLVLGCIEAEFFR